MSALTDFFTSLSNKIRNKLGTNITYTPTEAVNAIDDVYNKGITDTKKGNANTGDVKSGITFTSTNGVNLTGTFTAQTKSASSSTSAQTITPDSGKYLSSVSISAISPQRSLGTAATGSGIDATGPYVYLPYGWYPYRSASSNPYIYMTAAQAVTACPKQEKTITSSRSAQTVTPDSGKLLSKVTVNALTPTGTFNASTTRSTAIDMGATNNYRYVNTNSVSNTNSGTFTPTSNSSAHDMGATNTYRYVNTNTVYNSGYNSGYSEGADYRLNNLKFTPWHGDSVSARQSKTLTLDYNTMYLIVYDAFMQLNDANMTKISFHNAGSFKIEMSYGYARKTIIFSNPSSSSTGNYVVAVIQPWS